MTSVQMHGGNGTGRRSGRFMAAGLSLFFALASCVWLRLNRAPPNWDDAWYLANSLTLYDAWSAGGLMGLGQRFLASLGFKAPLIVALPLPFYWVFGRRWHAAFGVDIASMLVLFAAVWGIGKRLRSERAGEMAVWISGTLPLLYGLSRWYMVEYPMAALVAVAFWLALVIVDSATADSAGIAPAIALGLTCGAGLLLKVDFPIFVLPFLSYLAWQRRVGFRPILAVIVPSIGLAAPWYLYHWRATLDNAIAAGFGTPAIVQGTGPIFALSSVWKYLQLIAERGVSPYYVFLIAAALIAVAVRRRFEVFPQIAPLALWLAPFVLFAFAGNKDVRYIAPVLPAFAVALACFIDAATADWKWIAPAVLAFPLVSFFAVSFGWPYDAPDLGYALPYDTTSWGQDEILSVISGDVVYRYGERKTILLGTDRGRFNADNFHLAVMQRQLPFEVETTAYAASMAEVLGEARGAAYLVYKEGGEPESAFFNSHFGGVPSQLEESSEWRELPYSRKVPDGGTVHILRHRQLCCTPNADGQAP